MQLSGVLIREVFVLMCQWHGMQCCWHHFWCQRPNQPAATVFPASHAALWRTSPVWAACGFPVWHQAGLYTVWRCELWTFI